MLVILIAGGAALAVAAYKRVREHDPETAAALTRTVRELADVVLVCSRAVEGIVDALHATSRPRYAAAAAGTDWGSYRQPLVDTWEDE